MVFYNFFFVYIKVANKYYQKHKEKLQKEGRERYENLSEEEKEKKSISIIVNVIRIFLKKKSKRKLSIWEIYIYYIRDNFRLDSWIFWGGPGAIFFHGLVLEIWKIFRILFHGLVLDVYKSSENFVSWISLWSIKKF